VNVTELPDLLQRPPAVEMVVNAYGRLAWGSRVRFTPKSYRDNPRLLRQLRAISRHRARRPLENKDAAN
jgi:hypothetical protein